MTSSRTNRGASTLATLVVLILLQGCTAMSRPRAIPDDPEFAPVRPQAMMQRDRASGSIYQVSRNYNFYGDTVALNVGDVLTVTLQESTRASKNADTRIIKDNEIKLPEPNILGKSNFGIGTSLNNERDFKTRADADQSNSLAGSITVSVTEVLPNGVLRIRGEKWLSLTNGEEYIRLTGLVRPRDIQPDNSVASNRIADARIAYGGTGDFDQANQMGWLARFFNSEWWLL
ncbi:MULTISPECIES: flagellar basal body L-ring protein FlgH [Marinobacter]|jgi:flagellar L-ring protein precursor FlgH|uniref:Flagellar L-ring protein n=1 Tax=Marinobacter nauticus (strain ATCC 700491 / DSM 11845 / VT8) TaxID=351348 RepID=A1TZN1_MARN8|nr:MULTISPECIES: flagellar basal body L-ring protein FlgH [Marinobacter]MCP4062317.1 flagellar basal body L-ring protein FlgH [Gammaproteobacteria bacterium]OZB12071.1 MAG: flagellar basal body L-ring protein [Marinobacter sp. 34-60-7]ABM18200.1 flagellar L-ring protein [Marinobacter nauticus VT8]AKV97959.1 flagellar basal body L-ring protein [Marinobacter sp. CP1]MAH30806.1 flagellar basal body L-ring protein FlgH [Marinobacter sp.]